MLDPGEAFIAMTSCICTRNIVIDPVSKRSMQAGLALAFTILATDGEAKLDTVPAIAVSLFGWESDRAPTLDSPARLINLVPRLSRIAASEGEGRVVTAMEAPGFNTIYLELESNAHRFWIAAGSTNVRVGNVVRFFGDQVIAMDNFESKALKRTFERIYFVSAITVEEIDP